MRTVGNEIKGRLKKNKQSQKLLSHSTGIAPSYVNEVITGKRRLSSHNAVKIERFFNEEDLAYNLLLTQMEYELRLAFEEV